MSASSNRLNAVSGALSRAYSYNADGSPSTDGSNSYVYNDAGRLVSVTRSGITTSYVHNAFGQRVKKSSPTTTRHFFYDEAGHLVGEYDGTGTLIQETVWFNDIPVATLRPNGSSISVYYVHTDHLNTPRRLTRPSDGEVVWRWDSDPFGITAANEDADGDSVVVEYNLRFPGQYWDAEGATNYNDFRDYDPITGRYVESDPIGLAGGANTYSYVGANSLSRVDPYGLDWIEYTGQRLVMYGGSLGDRSRVIRSCAATSGATGYQSSENQRIPDAGPVPAGLYSVNLVPSPSRVARADPNTADLLGSPTGGIQRIPDSYTARDGITYEYSAWGTWRMRLDPKRGDTYGRYGFYLHNSHKGYTHGCIETCDELLNDVLKYRSAGNKSIDVLIRYLTRSTFGGTARP